MNVDYNPARGLSQGEKTGLTQTLERWENFLDNVGFRETYNIQELKLQLRTYAHAHTHVSSEYKKLKQKGKYLCHPELTRADWHHSWGWWAHHWHHWRATHVGCWHHTRPWRTSSSMKVMDKCQNKFAHQPDISETLEFFEDCQQASQLSASSSP